MEKTELEKQYEKRIAELSEEVRWLKEHISFLSKLIPLPQPLVTVSPNPLPNNPYDPFNPYAPTFPDILNPVVITQPWTTCESGSSIKISASPEYTTSNTIYYNGID